MDDKFTRPERCAARAQGRALMEDVKTAGGCRYCTRRAHIFQTEGRRAACGLDQPKAFPACVEQPGGFEFDDEAYP